jgi:hypothetical protein
LPDSFGEVLELEDEALVAEEESCSDGEVVASVLPEEVGEDLVTLLTLLGGLLVRHEFRLARSVVLP